MLELGFHGAAGTVTGSRFLLDAGDRRIQVDAGMFQGLKRLRKLNWRRPPFDPASVDALVLTHAHIDHSGALPRMVREGYSGPIYCTHATRELADILLLDAARIQEQDAEYANRKGFSKHHPAVPLFDSEDAEKTLALLKPVGWNQWIDLGGGVRSKFHNAGHILGSGVVELRVERGDGETTFVFSGDLGRYDATLHVDPEPRPECEVLVVESTYGDRRHESASVEDQIQPAFARTLGAGGIVLIPSFAVARAQQVTLILRNLIEAGKLPDVPIHIDSPMAVNATRVYARYRDEHHLDAELLDESRGGLFPRNVHLHRSVAESKRLNELSGPRIIISSSGMLTGGRVLHHLKRILPERRHLLAMVGYQAAGTRGRRLLQGQDTLRIHGRDIPVDCQFMVVSGLSAHADADELMRWLRSGHDAPERTFVVHGEPEASQALARRIESELGWSVDLPRLDERFRLDGVGARKRPA